MYKIENEIEFNGLPKKMANIANQVMIIDEPNFICGKKVQRGNQEVRSGDIELHINYKIYIDEATAREQEGILDDVEAAKADAEKKAEKFQKANADYESDKSTANKKIMMKAKENFEGVQKTLQDKFGLIDENAFRVGSETVTFDNFADFLAAYNDISATLFASNAFKDLTITSI